MYILIDRERERERRTERVQNISKTSTLLSEYMN